MPNVDHKHVASYYFEMHPSGIATLLINTHQRWVCFQRRTDHMYSFEGTEEDGFLPEDDFHIPEDAFVLSGLHVRPIEQEKDQIIVYFIPFQLIGA